MNVLRVRTLFILLLATGCSDRHSDSPEIQPGPHLELSRDLFPASLNCELSARYAEDCPEPVFTTFTLTYTVGADTVFVPGGSIAATPAYPYKGEYRTEQRYTRHIGWGKPQISDPTAANFTTAEVSNNPFGPVLPEILLPSKKKVVVRFDNRVGSGARIRITYGDRSGGGPGFLVPTLPLDIDLFIEQDPESDGVYTPVKTRMPTLRVIGTRLDRFVVTAPSTPGGKDFDIVVKAMQGADEPEKSLFLVQNYTGTITFSSSDRSARLPEDYTFTLEDRGFKEFKVALHGEGTHTITVRETGSSKTGTSNPVQLGKGEFRLFWGILQQHTNIGGHGLQTQDFAFEFGRDVADLDFLSLTEHCGSDHFDWEHSCEVADRFHRPGEFVTFKGYEWGTSRTGHRHIVYLDAAREKCHCHSAGTCSDVPRARTLDELFLALAAKEALIFPHHTGWRIFPEGEEPDDTDLFGDPENPSQILFEIFSHHGSSEKFDNHPYPIHGGGDDQRMEDGIAYFQNAIAAGYKFGITSGTDDHQGKPGGQIAPARPPGEPVLYARKGLTGVYAEQLTRESLWKAFKARRSYGTTGARILLDVRANGHLMGEEITSTTPPEIRVEATGTAPIEQIVLIKNGTREIHQTRPEGAVASMTYVDTDVVSGQEYSYYVRVEQEDLHLAWSSPIWVTILPEEGRGKTAPRTSAGTAAPNPERQ